MKIMSQFVSRLNAFRIFQWSHNERAISQIAQNHFSVMIQGLFTEHIKKLCNKQIITTHINARAQDLNFFNSKLLKNHRLFSLQCHKL